MSKYLYLPTTYRQKHIGSRHLFYLLTSVLAVNLLKKRSYHFKGSTSARRIFLVRFLDIFSRSGTFDLSVNYDVVAVLSGMTSPLVLQGRRRSRVCDDPISKRLPYLPTRGKDVGRRMGAYGSVECFFDVTHIFNLPLTSGLSSSNSFLK